MKKRNLPIAFFTLLLFLGNFVNAQNESFTMRQLACGLSQPWEIKFGPDDRLWVTEAHSYEITAIDPVSGDEHFMLDLSNKKNFPNFNQASTWPQGGLQGIAFHPDFANKPYIYVAYVHQFDGCLPDTMGCYFQSKIVRYDYDVTTEMFSNEEVLVDTIPGSTDHNGGRLVIGPDTSNTQYLFYSIGDMGAGQLSNSARPHNGQDVNHYEGKILRFNLERDGDLDYTDSWIPNDNPFNEPNKQSAVWSLGHRNPQGLAFSPDGKLYNSEHGPYSDDEINLVQEGYNYGFPLIMGFTDGNYDGSRAGDGSTLQTIVSEAANKQQIEMDFPYSDPLGSYIAVPKSTVSTIYTADFNNTPPFDFAFLQNPTIAPSGIEYYSSDAIPGWENSLLVSTLKLATVYRLKLSADGTAIVSDTIPYFSGLGRFRDIAISEDGKKIYVAADSMGILKGEPGEAVQPINKGCILEFTYMSTSTDEAYLNNSVKVFPNPVKGGQATLHINLDERAEVSAELFTAAGQRIESLISDQQVQAMDRQLNLHQYPAGSYYLKVQVDDKFIFKKLIRL